MEKMKRFRELRLKDVSLKPNLLPFQIEWLDINSKAMNLVNEVFFFFR